MWKYIIIILMLTSTLVHSNLSNWVVGRGIESVISACRKNKGILRDYRFINEKSDSFCLKYICHGAYYTKLQMGHGKKKVKIRKKELDNTVSGKFCNFTLDEKNRLDEILSKFQRIDYIKCYKKCEKNFDSNKCSKCLNKNTELAQCKISADYKDINCPGLVHRRTLNINSDIRALQKRLNNGSSQSIEPKSSSSKER